MACAHVSQTMESDHDPHAKLVLDTHFELLPPPNPKPKPRHRPTITKHDQRQDDARLVFNKVIESHYKDKGNGYSEVGSLFVTWESSDLPLHGVNSEVEQLKAIFKDTFLYKTDAFRIPSEQSEITLLLEVARFVRRYNDPNKLIVLYYAGHGFGGEGEDEESLTIAARDKGNGNDGDPQALFPDIITLLNKTQSDVLLIVDCCYAAKAFSKRRLGRRRFELLASSMVQSPSPGRKGSFTEVLIKVIKKLLQDQKHRNGFSMSNLYHELYHHPDLRTYKPLLFDQSQFDYGKIWLRPQAAPPSPPPPYKSDCHQRILTDVKSLSGKPDVTLDLRLHLRVTHEQRDDRDLVGLAMNELARQLQYLPHVQRIDFQELHAGDEEVKLFLNMLGRATIVKRFVRKLKERVATRRRQRLKQEDAANPSIGIARPPSFYEVLEKPEKSRTQDWSSTIGQLSDGSTITVAPQLNMPNPPKSQSPESMDRKLRSASIIQQGSPSPGYHLVHRRYRAFQLPGLIRISYILDFTGLWEAASGLLSRLVASCTRTDRGHMAGSDGTDVPELASHDSTSRDNKQWKGSIDRPTRTPQHRKHALHRVLPAERVLWLLLVAAVLVSMKGQNL